MLTLTESPPTVGQREKECAGYSDERRNSEYAAADELSRSQPGAV